MKKTTFNVILRLQDYYSDGLLEIIETEQLSKTLVFALMTDDPVIGYYYNGEMYLSIILGFNTSKQFTYDFNIKMDEISSPMVYSFSDNYSLEFVSVERDIEKVEYLESHFSIKME